MNKIEEFFNPEEIEQIKVITLKINALTTDLEGKEEEAAIAVAQEITVLKEQLETLRLKAFRREYDKLSEEDQYKWWLNEFENQIKSRTGGEYLYKMFTKEQYSYWVSLDPDFDDLFLQLCLDFDLEYEFAFSLCEHKKGSEMWEHLIDINKD
jgi:hypothetical protein